jgi:class 3 adenylate cyclase
VDAPTPTQPTDPKVGGAERLIERLDAPLLVLALVAVVLYLADLQGLGHGGALGVALHVVSRVIDVIFVADLVLKLSVLRRKYVLSPWALIDFISSLPALELLEVVGGLSGARFIRVFRFFRILRTMRMVRALGLPELQALEHADSPEKTALHRSMYGAVAVYTVLFYGLVNLASRFAPVGHENDGEFYLILGSLLGMLLVLVVTRFQVREVSARHIRALLNVALPRQVADHLMENPESLHRTVHMPATVVFCDLVGFTSAVEALDGDLITLKRHLEGAFDAVVRAHVAQDLIVDKFIGDAIMSFRGGDLVDGDPADHARRVVLASLHAKRALRELGDPYFQEMKFGGASAESAIIGTFGTSSRLSYTVLGDRVNLAARLEGACGQLGATNVFDHRTVELTDGCDGVVWRSLGSVRVKGQGSAHPVYEAFDPQDVGPWLDVYDQALARYQEQDFEGAGALFGQVDAARDGGDGPSRMFLALCAQLIDEGVDDDWTATLAMRK